MSPRMVGTVLPTAASLRADDVFARRQVRERERIGLANLADYDKRHVDGETRYYDGADRYAIVGYDLRVKWFARRADNYWYAVK